MFADEFLPTYDVSDAVGVVVAAAPAATWDALMSVDRIEIGRRNPLVGILSAVRMLPELVYGLLRGKRPPMPKQLRLRDTAAAPDSDRGWVLLCERPREAIALGLVGRFWRPVISYAPVAPGVSATTPNLGMPRRSMSSRCATPATAARC